MLEKAKQFYYRWYNKVSEFWTDERYIFAILTFLPPPILVGLLICFTIKAIIAGFNFLRLYYAQLIFAAFAVCVFVAWLDKRRADKISLEREAQEIRERQNYSDQYEAARTKDATYVAGDRKSVV